jgi:hypothetical protein
VADSFNPEESVSALSAGRHLAWVMPLMFTGLMSIASCVWFFSGDHAASAELGRRVGVLEQQRTDDVRYRDEMAQRLARMEPVLELIKERLVPASR